MALQRYVAHYERLSPDLLTEWGEIPSSVISDALNRCQCMHARIKPVVPGRRVCGQAFTVDPITADNSMVHHACSVAEEGSVIVVAGRGVEDTAYAGSWVVRGCIQRRLGGLVIDGSVRDIEEIRALSLPVFCSGAVPRGPHKNFGGRISVPVAVGGVSVSPGDLVVGDDDGVVIVPLTLARQALPHCKHVLEKELEWARRIEDGETLVEVLGVAPLEVVEMDTGIDV